MPLFAGESTLGRLYRRLIEGIGALKSQRRALTAAVLVSALIALAAAFSDYQYAGLRRRLARETAERYHRPGRSVWTTGHWGWQHYAALAGMRDLPAGENLPRRGDVLVRPTCTDAQGIVPEVMERLREIQRVDYHGTLPLVTLSREAQASFYQAWSQMPLALTGAPLATVVVYEVVRDP